MIRAAALLISASLALSGCAAPPEVMAKAEPVLGKHCSEIFHSFYYQLHAVTNVTTETYLALASDPNGQVCGLGEGTDEVLFEPLFGKFIPAYQSAINACEEARKNSNVSAPCRLFAHNNEIIWDYNSQATPVAASSPPPAPASPSYNSAQQAPATVQVREESLESAKEKCADLGFKKGTEKYGQCVLKLSR